MVQLASKEPALLLVQSSLWGRLQMICTSVVLAQVSGGVDEASVGADVDGASVGADVDGETEGDGVAVGLGLGLGGGGGDAMGVATGETPVVKPPPKPSAILPGVPSVPVISAMAMQPRSSWGRKWQCIMTLPVKRSVW